MAVWHYWHRAVCHLLIWRTKIDLNTAALPSLHPFAIPYYSESIPICLVLVSVDDDVHRCSYLQGQRFTPNS
eukprot:3050325-Pleurochrysis_carterae.AAC.3